MSAGPLCPAHYVRRPIVSGPLCPLASLWCKLRLYSRRTRQRPKKDGRLLLACVVFLRGLCFGLPCVVPIYDRQKSAHKERVLSTLCSEINNWVVGCALRHRTFSNSINSLDSSVNESFVFLYFSIRTPMEISHGNIVNLWAIYFKWWPITGP